jgi:hypothetical protein
LSSQAALFVILKQAQSAPLKNLELKGATVGGPRAGFWAVVALSQECGHTPSVEILQLRASRSPQNDKGGRTAPKNVAQNEAVPKWR